MASSWRAAFRASTDGPFGAARLGMLPFVFPELAVRYKHHLGRRWLVCFRFHCVPTSIPKIYQIRALRNRTQRTRMIFEDGPMESHEQGLSNELSPRTIRGRLGRLRSAPKRDGSGNRMEVGTPACTSKYLPTFPTRLALLNKIQLRRMRLINKFLSPKCAHGLGDVDTYFF